MALVPYPHVEAMVITRLAILTAGDDAGTANTALETVPKVDANFDDAAFPKIAIRLAIIDNMMEVVSFICRAEGDPRRIQYRVSTPVAHRGVLPPSMGPYGAISDPATGRDLEERSATEIFEIIQQQAGGLLPASSKFYYKAIDGTNLYHTLPGNADVESFNLDRPASSFSAIDTLFSSESNFMPIPDEFDIPIADAAAGRLAMSAGSFVESAAGYLQAYYEGMRNRGINMVPIDFPAQPRS